MLDLTIAIPVRNEEKNLAFCLDSIGNDFAKYVEIIDSKSIDGTKRIAESYGVKVIDFDWDGKFPKKRNWYLRNHAPSTKWVLFLDADECLTAEFKEELRKKILNEEIVGYWLSYSIYFMGKLLKGGYPLRKLALLQVGKGEYGEIFEDDWSTIDLETHDHPILDGATGIIKSKIDHRDFNGLTHYVSKHNNYSGCEARIYQQLYSSPELQKSWTWKQKFKYRLLASVFLAPIYFLGTYFVMGGFRDGKRGFVFAILKMSYFAQIYCKIKENVLVVQK